MYKKNLLPIAISLMFTGIHSHATSVINLAPANVTEANKKLVTSFYLMAFNEQKPAAAMEKYVGTKYTQHNPFVADGKKPFIDFFTGFQKKNPDARIEIKRAIAEGDLVVVHVLSKINAADRGRAVMDIFRIENGKIVEHWDVGQAIPDQSANDNTMF